VLLSNRSGADEFAVRRESYRCEAPRAIAPILLGDGIRLYDNPGNEPIRLHVVGGENPTSVINAPYRPATTARSPT
jgi:hypothetical protein